MKTRIARLLMLTLCFNIHVDKYYIADTAMEPLFWVVDHFTKFFGPLFVTGVCLLITSAVAIAYVIGIPYWWHRSVFALIILIIVGHWLLINIVFHYIMATVTSPGYLPTGVLIPEAVSICKKCIAPKPPRTHHCSVCNRCILKMDHHCRIFALNLDLPEHNSTIMNFLVLKPEPDPSFITWIKQTEFYHNAIMYLAFLCVGVLLTLGSLVVWHVYLISNGQTSIEALINKAEKIRCSKDKKAFLNPYDFGLKENWRLFMGLHDGRNWRHVVFPSWHKPIGTGLQWPNVIQFKQTV
uniref:Palmitoyltransferase n=1 Tax=Strigamia maritima TaxID=126957 RepID=T1IIZ3_STRMM